MQVYFLQNQRKIPVLIPDSRESGRESGLLRTAPTAISLPKLDRAIATVGNEHRRFEGKSDLIQVVRQLAEWP
jgi:hypothetical protein